MAPNLNIMLKINSSSKYWIPFEAFSLQFSIKTLSSLTLYYDHAQKKILFFFTPEWMNK